MNIRRVEKYPVNPDLNFVVGDLFLIEFEGVNNDESLLNVCNKVFCDLVFEKLYTDALSGQYDCFAEVWFKPGVTDNVASTAKAAFNLLEYDVTVHSGIGFYFSKNKLKEIGLEDHNDIKSWIYSKYANPLLQTVYISKTNEFKIPSHYQNPYLIGGFNNLTQEFDLNLNHLMDLSKKNCWALNDIEIESIIKYFTNLGRVPTDVEMEIIAQTWSEHCKHKIFQADIIDENGQHVSSIFKEYIRKATTELKQEGIDWLVSVFSDNAGVVGWDSKIDLCIKVETHNSPSALDPYGGAITGILGVNRDIMGCGIGAKPIANTNVLCFAPLETSDEALPMSILPPKRVLEGVHLGIEHGGNKSGIPTVNGSFYFDESYLGKPLVYCGTIGVLPKKLADGRSGYSKNAVAGDGIFLVGGGTGKDGIHGATFSSLELDANVSSSVVQIGDPFTQKKVLDFLLDARDQCLYNSVTDNGAGGISSSVGEMAKEAGGAIIHVENIHTKYPGLLPWEIIVSESQERMTFAVPKTNKEKFIALALRWGVQVSRIGEFTNSNKFEVYSYDKCIASLDLDWLHDGLPQMKLSAKKESKFKWPSIIESTTNLGTALRNRLARRKNIDPKKISLSEISKNIMSSANVASKERLVRRYDHEVQAATLIKPFQGQTQSAPSDAGVILLEAHGGEKGKAISISHGLSPRLSLYNTYLMSQMAVDEAIRNAICTGVSLKKMCLLDNFCWPDPTQNNSDGAHKTAQLVMAARGLYDAAKTFRAPFVSGKDSMKNDFKGQFQDGTSVQISCLPTVLVTAMGYIDRLSDIRGMYFNEVGDQIFIVGPHDFSKNLGCALSELYYQYHLPDTLEKVPILNLEKNIQVYKKLKHVWDIVESIHDVSDGGLLTAIMESCFGKKNGCKLVLPDTIENQDAFINLLYGESGGRFVISVKTNNVEKFKQAFDVSECIHLGEVISEFELNLLSSYHNEDINLIAMYETWKGVF